MALEKYGLSYLGNSSYLIETDPNHAIICFRGSESTDENQIIKDWINADFGLLMDRDTLQQNNAADYMKEINGRFAYGCYAVTGHSLGGNLAEHAVIAAPDDMRNRREKKQEQGKRLKGLKKYS